VSRRYDDGEKILDYARSKDLALSNTFFTKTDENISIHAKAV